MVKSSIVAKKVQMSQLEVKQYFEMLNKYISGNGINASLTYAALKTIKSLEKDYNEIMAGLYNPDTDPKFAEYKQRVDELVMKYADRDEQGELKLDSNKRPVITEQIVEYQNDIKKLQEEFVETLKLVNGANDFNRNFLNQGKEVTIYTWRIIEEVPDEIPGVFMLYMFKEEF
jgi:hypothetical protein